MADGAGPAAGWLAGGGEMGRLIREKDWSQTPLGPIEGWPQSLRTAVSICLSSNFPINIIWGPHRVQIYNDGYWPLCGAKHPGSLGQDYRECWESAWPALGAPFGNARAGRTGFLVNERMFLDRDRYLEETFFTFSLSPIRDESGGVGGLFHPVTEMTQQTLGERRLKILRDLADGTAEAKTVAAACQSIARTLAGHSLDVPFALLYLLDAEGRRATLAGVSGLAPGTPACPAEAGLEAGAAGWPLARAVRGRRVIEVDDLARRVGLVTAGPYPEPPRTAMVLPVSISGLSRPAGVLVAGVSARRALDGPYRTFYLMLRDSVTNALANARAYEQERRRAEALAELDAAKTAFLANVSHEFRTPLTLMLGPVSDALADAPPGSELARRLAMVARNGRRLERLVGALLEFSRMEAGQARPQLRIVDVGALTGGIASSFADVCRLAGIELVTDCRSVPAAVDPGMWETIVLNLVSNAFKYTLAGTITVRAGPAAGGGVEVTVADTGTGIAAEHLPHLFDRFYRAPGATGRSAEGSGIGLALVRGLVEMHHGSIQAASTPGQGTTMLIRLPAPRAAPGTGPAAGQPQPAARGGTYVDEALGWLDATAPGARAEPAAGRQLVLVADDNADMRAHLAAVLGKRWQVVTAADGRQALELARRHRPDVLVTDVMMPGVDGLALVTAVRADPRLAGLPVLMLSARAGAEAAGDGVAAGADGYLVKPFRSADLVNMVAARLQAAGRDRSRGEHDELAARRGLALADLGTALAAARSAEEALDALLAEPLASAGATMAGAGLLTSDGGQLRMAFRGQVRDETASRYHLIGLDAPIPLAAVARDGEPMTVPDTALLDPRYTLAAADVAEARSAIVHPLRAGGAVIGAVTLSWPRPREFTPADVEVTGRAVGMLARALARIAAAQREHQVAAALQERLLDPGPGSPAAVTAASYQPATEAMRVGGDWYTVTALGPGRTGVSAGDVAGHGLDAAAMMSQLRSVLAGAALSSPDPAAVLGVLDRYARGLPGAAFATAAYAVIDTAAGTVDYTCAGHPYPLVVDPDGSTRYLRGSRRAPLAGRSAAAPAVPAERDALAPGSMLLLYTDGLIERRGESLDAGFARLASAAAGCARLPAAAACAVLLEQMAPAGGYTDDVAIVAARPAGTTPESHVDAVPAAFTEMAGARQRLRGWLGLLAVDPVQADRIVLAAGEALANAIEHGSGGDPDRTVGIEAFADRDTVTVTVGDSGRWAKDSAAGRAAGRGRGLTLLHGLASNVQTVRDAFGTTVTITCPSGSPEVVPRKR